MISELIKSPKCETEIISVDCRIVVAAEKMPCCPNCQEDELSLITATSVFCNACNKWFHKNN